MTGPRIRVLGAAFAAVPSSSPHASAMSSMIGGLRADLDLVSLKTEDLPHTKRIGDARMFRVPVGSADQAEQRSTYARAVARQIEAEPYAVVHVLDPWAGVVAAERREEYGHSLVYEMATFPDEDPEGWLVAHEQTLAAADRVIVATDAAKAALAGANPGLARLIDVVRPGIDVGQLDWGPVGSFGVPRILFLGSFAPSRDLDTLLDALGQVTSHRPVRALFAGERDLGRRSEMRERIKRAKLDEIVDVRADPKPHHLGAVMSAADLCVAPALGELAGGCAELPQPLLEYLACYRPVVAADVPGVSEMVRDEVEGLLYPPRSPRALADAILEVLRDAVMRERITNAGYCRVRDELSSGARRRHIRQIYEHIAPGSQVFDPWQEDLEGLIELSTGAIEILEEHAAAKETNPLPDEGVFEEADTGERKISEARVTDTDSGETRADTTDTGETDAVTTDTAESDSPAERRGEKTKPKGRLPRPRPDTNPGLVVPDTDPGPR